MIATSLSGGRPGAAYWYTPYGEVEFAVGETDETRSELGYTNALRLSGSLLYLKARVYDTQARVFIQADDVDRLRYAYVQGDPVNASDPTGLMPLGPGATVMLDGLVLTGGLGDRIAERMMMASHQQAVDVAPSNEVQTQGEGAERKGDGIGLHNEAAAGETAEGALDSLTSAAEGATAALAAYSVDPKNNVALRAGAAVLGSITSLADKDTIGKTAATLALGGLALAAAPVVIGNTAEGTGLIGLAQGVAARAAVAEATSAGGAAITTGGAAQSTVLLRTARDLQKGFAKHGADFGLEGNWNPGRAAEFSRAIHQHINGAATEAISGTYRGAEVIHYLNRASGLNAISSPGGQYISVGG